MRRNRSDLIVAVVLIGALILITMLLTRGSGNSTASWMGTGNLTGEKVGIVKVNGIIADASDWIRELDDFRRDDRIKAIVVRLESPGGVTAASQELYEAIKRARAEKPVVASMGNIATSGAYYAALGADTIMANPSTTTGSIGVILELTQFHDLMQKIGVGSEVIKSGKFKDSGNPARELTPDERAYFQGYIDDAFDQFLRTVSEERSLELSRARKIADGRVFTGRQALELGLVDLLGDQYTAVHLAAEMAGVEGEPAVVYPPRRRSYEWMDLLLNGVTDHLVNRLEGPGVFQYRWKPETVR